MTVALTDIRDVMLLSLACVAGAVLAPILPVVGLPLCAAGLGGHVYQGRRLIVAFTVIAAVAASAWARIVDPIAVGVALGGILVASARLRRSDAYATAAWLAPLLAGGFALTEIVAARLSGHTFGEYLTSAAEQTVELVGSGGALGGVPVTELTEAMLRFAPAVYVLLGAAAAVPTLAALVWTATRSGAVIRPTPKLERVDLSPHVLWPLVVGVGFLAAGRVWGGADGLATTVGLNLLLVSRLLLLVQGLGLVAALLGRAGIRGVGFVLGLLLAFVIDSASWFVSLAGLADFWVNFRRLSRGAQPDSTEGPVQGH